jgi:hypothetical protein
MSKKARVLQALQNGDRLTAKQIAARFGAGNPGQVVSSIRREGYPVYLNKSVNSKGEVKGFYRLGSPTRRMIAVGHKAISAGFADAL